MYYSTGEYSSNGSETLRRYILEIFPLGVKAVERNYIAKMVHYMCCNSSMLWKEYTHAISHAYGESNKELFDGYRCKRV